jgi:hypothetical protein
MLFHGHHGVINKGSEDLKSGKHSSCVTVTTGKVMKQFIREMGQEKIFTIVNTIETSFWKILL